MKHKYILHYGDYAVGDNERLYTEMAAQGWHLIKRGQRLSKFTQGVPSEEQYRIELISPEVMEFEEEGRLDAKTNEKLEKNGWAYVLSNGMVHVFKGSGAKKMPILWDKPGQQSATMTALRREYRTGIGVSILVVAALAMLAGSDGLSHWLMFPEFYLLMGLGLFLAIGNLAYGAVRTMVLFKGLRAGKPIDRSPKSNTFLRKAGICAGSAILIILLLLTVLTVLRSRHYEMPSEADGPYLTLADLGWEGEPMVDLESGEVRDNTVQYESNLLAEVWDTYEGVALSADSEAWIYSTVYRVKAGWLEKGMPAYLANGSTFQQELNQYEAVEVEGLDAACISPNGLEYIATRGNLAWYIIYADPGVFGPDESPEKDVFAALAAKMN